MRSEGSHSTSGREKEGRKEGGKEGRKEGKKERVLLLPYMSQILLQEWRR